MPSMHMERRQAQALTPRLQMAVKLLQLSALDYERELMEMMGTNPFLDFEDGMSASPPLPSADARAPALEEHPQVSGDAREPAEEATHGGDLDAADWAQETQTCGAEPVRKSSEAFAQGTADILEAQDDLRQRLQRQAHFLPLSARDHALVCLVIGSLEDDGYLRASLDELAEVAELEPPADIQEISTALRLVQSFEPTGVGARDVAECLLLQTDAIAVEHRELARRMLREQVDRLARRDLAGIAAALDRTPAQVEAACLALRRLDPRPGLRNAPDRQQHVVPDVVVKRVRGAWTVQLNPAAQPRFRLNRSCAELFQRNRGTRHVEMNRHLQDAQWTLRNIEQRCSTILQVSREIMKRQHLFFEHGPLAMKPLTLREVADEVGVHESTVCRVTNNKFMATPSGLFELKHFFSRAMPIAGGGASTGTAIRTFVKEMIDGEDAHEPLSDVAIARRLGSAGVNVARRTVTKYRQSLRIAPAERRRALGGAASPKD